MLKNKQIIHAIALCKHGSIRKAATAVHLSQPAFSRSIAALEAELGVPLFVRMSSGVEPTEYGELLCRRGKILLHELLDLRHEIELTRTGGAGKLKVAMGPYPSEISGHRAIGRMLRKAPDIECKAIVTDWRRVSQLIFNSEVNLGLAELSSTDQDERLQQKPIGSHNLYFLCRPDHPLAKQRRVTEKNLQLFPTITIRFPQRMKTNFPGMTIVDEETGDRLPSVEVEDLSSARQSVAESDGFIPSSLYQARYELKSGELSVLNFKAPWMVLNYGTIYLKGRTLTGVENNFIEQVFKIEEEVRQATRVLEQEYLPEWMRSMVN